MITLTDIQAKVAPATLASQDIAAITAEFNAALPAVLGKIERAEFAMWAASCGMRSKIEDHSVDKTSLLRDAALACRDVILGAATGIDFAMLPNQQMLGAWGAMGELTQANHDALLALATHPATPVSAHDITLCVQNSDGTWNV